MSDYVEFDGVIPPHGNKAILDLNFVTELCRVLLRTPPITGVCGFSTEMMSQVGVGKGIVFSVCFKKEDEALTIVEAVLRDTFSLQVFILGEPHDLAKPKI